MCKKYFSQAFVYIIKLKKYTKLGWGGGGKGICMPMHSAYPVKAECNKSRSMPTNWSNTFTHPIIITAVGGGGA